MDSAYSGRRAFLAGLGACVASVSGCLDTDRTQSVRPVASEGDAAIDGTFHDSLVLFRNDDPAPWTDLEVLRSVDDVFADRGVPLTHAVVTRDTDRDEELGPDHPVSQYLADLATERGDQVGFAVHGRTHEAVTDFQQGSEFGGLPAEAQRRRVEAASAHFADCLDAAPSVFVPPFNTYDEQTVEVLRAAGFSVVSGSVYPQEQHFGERGFWRDDGLVHLPATLSMEDWETETVRDPAELRSDFDENRRSTSLNVVMLHYYFYDDADARETLADLVEYAAESDGRCMTLDGFAARATAGDVERVDGGWVVAA